MSPETLRYRLLEHTADLKAEIYGRDLKELFCNAAFMLFDVMVDLNRVSEDRQEEIALESTDLSELFLDWLRELLFLFSTRGFVTKRVEIRILEPERAALQAVVYGAGYEPDRHGLKIEIKTPTYHQYRLESLPEGCRATVIFDV